MGASLQAEVTQGVKVGRFSQSNLSPLTEDRAADFAVLNQVYAERDLAPIWVKKSQPSDRGRELLRMLKGASYDGLDPDDYDIQNIERLMRSSDPNDLAELDIRLSLSLMQFLSDLGSGRTEPNVLDPELFVYPRDIDRAKAIKGAAEADNIGVFVGGYRPNQVDYWRLKGALASYRAMAKVGGWPKIDKGPLLEGGERSARVGQVRALLLRLGDLKPVYSSADQREHPDVFDMSLIAAVKRFQRRHGLEQDGVVGPATLKAMNTPIEDRIKQIVLNLERRRWMMDRIGQRYIKVNLADFHLQLMDKGKVAFETPVVIGSLYNKTPIFTSDMTYLVFNPYWNVPKSIVFKEIIPKVRLDPGYLDRNGFELFSDWSADASLIDPRAVNWSTQRKETFGYKLRQRPGRTNALGRLKFIMPNDYSIYLHDTPSRQLFSRRERSFSHGCVRVADPEALADAILQGQDDWSWSKIWNIVESGERKVVHLDKPLPVQMTYLTSWVDQDNKVHFRNDVYNRDQILADALIGDPLSQGTHTADISIEAPELSNQQTIAQ